MTSASTSGVQYHSLHLNKGKGKLGFYHLEFTSKSHYTNTQTLAERYVVIMPSNMNVTFHQEPPNANKTNKIKAHARFYTILEIFKIFDNVPSARACSIPIGY